MDSSLHVYIWVRTLLIGIICLLSINVFAVKPVVGPACVAAVNDPTSAVRPGQGVKVEQFYSLVQSQKPIFFDYNRHVALRFKAQLIMAPDKKKDSLQRKTRDKYKGDIRSVRDILRSTLVFETLPELMEAFHWIRSNVSILYKKNYFVSPKDTGYRSLQFSILLFGGVMAEIQLHLRPLYELKVSQGDVVYHEIRDLQAKENLSFEEQRLLLGLVTRHKLLFDSAWLSLTTAQGNR